METLTNFSNFTEMTFNVSNTYVSPMRLSNDLLHIVFWLLVLALLCNIILMRLSLNYIKKKTWYGKERKIVDISFNKKWILKNKNQFIMWNLFIILSLCLAISINHLSIIIWGIGV